MAFDSGLVEALVLDTKFAHGAFIVMGRSLVGADDLPTAEAEEFLAVPTPGGRRSLSRCAARPGACCQFYLSCLFWLPESQ